MRIISGEFRGRRLKVPPGYTVRPTADRVKEALFALLGSAVRGARVLELFAGSGALALEALSRGATSAVLVERDLGCLRAIRENIQALGVTDRTRIVRGDALRYVRQMGERGEHFDLLFADPPYGGDVARQVAQVLLSEPRLVSIAVIEHDRREEPVPEPPPEVGLDRRTYGDTALTVLTFLN